MNFLSQKTYFLIKVTNLSVKNRWAMLIGSCTVVLAKTIVHVLTNLSTQSNRIRPMHLSLSVSRSNQLKSPLFSTDRKSNIENYFRPFRERVAPEAQNCRNYAFLAFYLKIK